MTTYVLRDGRLVPKQTAAPASHVHVISDTMAPTKHMATGRIHDSKTKFRADTKATGCEEVGNDPAGARPSRRLEPDTKDIVNDIKRAIAELRSR